MRPFSTSATEIPFLARKKAAEQPMMPPPMMTTSAALGSFSSL
jgi:hypothetical protein